MGSQLRVEVIPRSEPAHLRHARAVFLVVGQIMALRVVEVLQAVLEVAQKSVGRGQLGRRF
ncbi:MAG TPA: hypothetical protein VMV01_12240, partial [Planctomycetota bacterium]|nr:hypothetical protein [Planctomycetota bacterium]